LKETATNVLGVLVVVVVLLSLSIELSSKTLCLCAYHIQSHGCSYWILLLVTFTLT